MSNDIITEVNQVVDRFGEELIPNIGIIAKTNRNYDDDFMQLERKMVKVNKTITIISDTTETKMLSPFNEKIVIQKLEESLRTITFGVLYDASFALSNDERFYAGESRTILAAIKNAARSIKHTAEVLVLREIYKNPDVLVLPNGGVDGLEDFATMKMAAQDVLGGYENTNGRLGNVVTYINGETQFNIESKPTIYQYSKNGKEYFDGGLSNPNQEVALDTYLSDYVMSVKDLSIHRSPYLNKTSFVKDVLGKESDDVVEQVSDVKYTSVLEGLEFKVYLTNESDVEVNIPADVFIRASKNAHLVTGAIKIDASETLDVSSLVKINQKLIVEESGTLIKVQKRSDLRNFMFNDRAVLFGMVSPWADKADNIAVAFDNALNIGYRVIVGAFNTDTKRKTISIDAYITAEKFDDQILVF